MNKKLLIVFIFALFFLAQMSAYAILRVNRAPFKLPTTLPAKIHGFKYMAGIQEIDQSTYSQDYRPRIWVELSKKHISFMRRRIDQKTLNKRSRKLEEVELAKIPYKKIDEVWYGEDALRKLAVTRLPTVSKNIWDVRSNSYRPLEIALDQQHRSPVVILYRVSRKKEGSAVIMGPNDKSAALYRLLMSKIIK